MAVVQDGAASADTRPADAAVRPGLPAVWPGLAAGWARPRLVSVLVTVGFLLTLLWTCAPMIRGRYALDLDVYLTAGRAVAGGQSLYGFQLQGKYSFTYPPFAGLFLVPARGLPLGAVLLVVTLASIAALYLLVRICGFVARPTVTTRSGTALLAALVVASAALQPMRSNLGLGQVNLLLAVVIAYDLLGRSHRTSRGVWTGVAAAVKLTPAIFVVYLLLRRRYREAAWGVGGFAVASTVGLVLLPGDSVRYWTHNLVHASGVGDIGRSANQSILGVVRRIEPPSQVPVWWLGLALPIGALGMVAAVAVSRRGNEVLALGLVGITGCLVSPVSWTHHWVWFVPVLFGLASGEGAGRRTRAAVAVLIAGYLVGINLVPQQWVLHDGRPKDIADMGYLLLAVSAMLVSAWSAHAPLFRRAARPVVEFSSPRR